MLGVGGACGPQSERDVATQGRTAQFGWPGLRHVRARGEARRDIRHHGHGSGGNF